MEWRFTTGLAHACVHATVAPTPPHTSYTRPSRHDHTYVAAARVLFGMASGCAIPASAAAVASYVVSERRSSSLSLIFTFFNCGSAFGLLLAGGLISTLGWQSVFLAFGKKVSRLTCEL